MSEDARIVQLNPFFEVGVLARVATEVERWLRPVDRIDYLARRWLIPIRFEGPTQSNPAKKFFVQHNGLSSDIQHAIGERLRAQYVVEPSLPARLTKLLRDFEQQNSGAEGFPRSGYAT